MSLPPGDDRRDCFPSDPSVQFVPMIREGGLMGDCGLEICGDDIPQEYQVMRPQSIYHALYAIDLVVRLSWDLMSLMSLVTQPCRPWRLCRSGW